MRLEGKKTTEKKNERKYLNEGKKREGKKTEVKRETLLHLASRVESFSGVYRGYKVRMVTEGRQKPPPPSHFYHPLPSFSTSFESIISGQDYMQTPFIFGGVIRKISAD